MQAHIIRGLAVTASIAWAAAAFAGSITSPASDAVATKFATEALTSTTTANVQPMVYTLGVARGTGQNMTMVVDLSGAMWKTFPTLGTTGNFTLTYKRGCIGGSECAVDVQVNSPTAAGATITLSGIQLTNHSLNVPGGAVSLTVTMKDPGETVAVDPPAATRLMATSVSAVKVSGVGPQATTIDLNAPSGPFRGFVPGSLATASVAGVGISFENNTQGAKAADGVTTFDYRSTTGTVQFSLTDTASFAGLAAYPMSLCLEAALGNCTVGLIFSVGGSTATLTVGSGAFPSAGNTLAAVLSFFADGTTMLASRTLSLSSAIVPQVGSSHTQNDAGFWVWNLNATLPSFTSGALPSGTVGQPYSFTFMASGSPAPAFALAGGAFPPGIGPLNVNGSISGTPTSAGTFVGTVAATNVVGAVTQSFSLTINPAAAAATPVCNIVASRGSVSPGTSVTLTAVCNPAATSFVWTGGTCANVSTATCTTAPAVTTTYTVAGTNNGGRGAAASAVISVTAPAFPIQTNSNVTASTATATAVIQPAPPDVGRTESIFVFAHAPRSLLAKSAAKYGHAGIPIQELDGPDLCVLAQAGPNGGLVGVTAETMQAYLTSIIAAQGQSISVLTNVPTPDVAGASFFVGYGGSASTMLASGTYQGVVTVNGQVQCTAAIAGPAAPHVPDELTGLWWNANESGWGIHFTQRKNVLFAAWYTYDSAGNPKWYVSTCNMPGTQATITGTCTGTLFEVNGPNFFGAAFDTSTVHSSNAGDLQVTFTSANAASMTYHVGVQTRTVALTRQQLSTGSTQPAVNNSDLWWNQTESGWGMAMAQQFGVNFLAWYVYDASGKPTWFVATCAVTGSSCSGTLYRTTGPALGPTFNPNAVHATAAGTITVNFTDANNAAVTYTVDGVTASKMITRQLF